MSRQVTAETFQTFQSHSDFVEDIESEFVPGMKVHSAHASDVNSNLSRSPRMYAPRLDMDVDTIHISVRSGDLHTYAAEKCKETLPLPLMDVPTGDSELMYDVRLSQQTPRGDEQYVD